MGKLDDKYEQKQLQNIRRQLRRIKALYSGVIDRVTIQANSIIYRGQAFKLSDYPLLKDIIKEELKVLRKGILVELSNGIRDSWDSSNQKNDELVKERLGGKKPTKFASDRLYNPNEEALREFLKRKEKGLNLSTRIFKATKDFKNQLETGLATGINEGKSAAEMARTIRESLVNPDKLFRKVRDDKGELQLSRAAKNFHPGRGVYRSSYKNTLRLTVTENNAAYRTADNVRWQQLPFVIGQEIKLSRNHPRFDICNSLVGRYPKDYIHKGFHPFCLCYAVAIQCSDEEYEKIEDSILGLSDDPPDLAQIDKIPASAVKWMEKNAERVKGYKQLPYFISDNKEYLGGFLK